MTAAHKLKKEPTPIAVTFKDQLIDPKKAD
jgi:hypothetical protein